MKAVSVRELKARLSAYLDQVGRGEVVLVTNRGKVVAELREPSSRGPRHDFERALWPLVLRGEIKLAQQRNDASAYGRTGIELPVKVIERDIEEMRKEAHDDLLGDTEAR